MAFGLLFDLVFAAAGFATTRLMRMDGGRGLLEVWAAVVRWGLPALVTVVAGVLAAAALLLPPADLKDQAWTALWTVAGASGAQLMRQEVHDPLMSGELLFHLWAVGVAAQLVLGWTMVLAAMTRSGLARWAPAAILVGFLLSLGLDIWMRRQGWPLHAAYLAPANAWPFLMGAAYAGPTRDSTPYEVSARSRLARAGDLLWPFCLWLWPMAVLPPMILARPLTLIEWTAVLVAAALAALATHRWIETPVRRRLGFRPRNALLAGLVAAVGLAGLSGAILAAGGFPGRADARLLAEEAAVRQRLPLQAVCNIEEGRGLPPAAACTTPPDGPAEVIVWGNSHAAHLTPAILDWTSGNGLRMRQVTRSGCLPLLGSADGLADTDCQAFNAAVVAEMGQGPRPRLVLLGAAWTVILARSPGGDGTEVQALERDLSATVRRLRAIVGSETGIVLLGDTPDFRFAPAACHARRRFLGMDTGRCDLAPPARAATASTIDALLNRVAAAEPGVHVFRPADALCRAGRCRTRSPEGPWYADSHHLTPAGGRAQADALAGMLDEASVAR